MSDVLFVDWGDEHSQTFTEALKSQAYGWNVIWESSLDTARKLLYESADIEVVVVSIDQHGSEGVQFLTDVKDNLPEMVRISAISGDNSQLFFKAASVSHQCVDKPYDAYEVKILMLRAQSLRERLGTCALRERLHAIGGLPSLPKLYKEIMEEMHSPEASLARVGEIVEQDVSLSAKILQVVNSAAIGIRNEVTSVSQAVTLLGMEKLSSMVLLAEVYSLVGQEKLPTGFSLDGLWRHSLRVANYSKMIAQDAIDDAHLADAAMTAGLLHDVGMVILAAHFSEDLGKVLAMAEEQDITLWEAEKEVFGSTHAEIGGYLLELWGLPDPIVEAVTFHDLPSGVPEEDYPSLVPEHGFTPLTAVHIANYFCEDERRAAYGCVEGEIDSFYMERLGFMDNLEEWWRVCDEESVNA